MAFIVLLAGGHAEVAISGPDQYFSEKTRAIVGGRKVLIIMPQAHLGATLEWDPPLRDIGGEPTLVFSSEQDVARYNEEVLKAEQFIAPLRKALRTFDFEWKMRARLESIVTASAWLGAQDVELTRNFHSDNLLQELNDSDTRQMLMLFTNHRAGANYLCIVTTLKATILVRQIPRGKPSRARLSAKYIPYQLSFNAIANLADADPKDPQGNLQRWAADDGRLARQAIERSIDWVTSRFAGNLDETREQHAQWQKRGDRKGVLPDGTPGWILSRDGVDVELYEPRSESLNFETRVGP